MEESRAPPKAPASTPTIVIPTWDGGQEAVRILGQRQRRAAPGSLALQCGQPGAAGGDDGELAHREGAVQQDEQEDQQQFEADGHRGRFPGVGLAAVYPPRRVP
jgi:hypothetical protein